MIKGSITIYNDSEKVMRMIAARFMKVTDELKDGANIIIQYLEILNKIIIEVYLELVKGHLKGRYIFQDNPGSILFK